MLPERAWRFVESLVETLEETDVDHEAGEDDEDDEDEEGGGGWASLILTMMWEDAQGKDGKWSSYFGEPSGPSSKAQTS